MQEFQTEKQRLNYYKSSEFKQLFLERIQICSIRFQLVSIEQKELWRESVTLIQRWVKQQIVFSFQVRPHLDYLFEMIAHNIFRPLHRLIDTTPPLETYNCTLEDTIQQKKDPNWALLQPIYQIFMTIIVNVDLKSFKMHISENFIREFFFLFCSQEKRQAQYLKILLSRMYAKAVPKRKMIRQFMIEFMVTAIEEKREVAGMDQLLPMVCSIISGFSVPLREENRKWMIEALIPLHKLPNFAIFQSQYSRSMTLSLAKDASLGPLIVERILKHWSGDSLKQKHLLRSLRTITSTIPSQSLQRYVNHSLKIISKHLNSNNPHLSQQALQFYS